MFRFGASEMLFAYLLVPALVTLAWWATDRRRRDLARFGQMHLEGGLANNRQIIPAWWIRSNMKT